MLMGIMGVQAQTTETLSSDARTLSGSDNCTITFTGTDKLSSNRIKLVTNGTFTITAKKNKITKVVISWRDSKAPEDGKLTANVGTYTNSTSTWESSNGETAVTFTNSGNEVSVTKLVITYKGDDGGDTPAPVTKKDITMSFPKTSYTATLGETFASPALSVSVQGLDIDYSSSNTKVATVAQDGTVTLVGAGSTTITAAFAGNDSYNANSASYTLKVSEKQTEPDTPTTDGTTWDFTSVSDDDYNAIAADATNWKKDAKVDRYGNANALNDAELTANGKTLKITKGLKFTASSADKVRIDRANKRLGLNGSNIKISIPVVKGSTITVTAVSGSASSTGWQKRYLSISDATVKSGFAQTDAGYADYTDNVATATADGYVTIATVNGGMNIQKITVTGTSTTPDEPSHTSADVTEPTEGTSNTDVTTNAVSRDNTQNQLKVTANGTVHYYNTADLTNVNVDKEYGEVTITTKNGTDKYYGSATNIAFVKATEKTTPVDIKGSITITEAKGWNESAYIKWTPISGATSYHVYVKGGQYADYTRIDQQLVRKYASYGRADAVGLRKGTYSMKVVAVVNGTEQSNVYGEATGLDVHNFNRGGFAHFNYSKGVGAYNNDGTLKEDAQVVYVTKDNAKTVSLSIKSGTNKETTYTGLQQIVYGYQKGYETRPLDIRLLGKISKEDCDELLSSSEGLQIKGSSEYTNVNITIEGIGDDASIHGFGMLVRNVDGVELRNFGVMWFMDDGISLDTKNSHVWVHNIDIFYGQVGSDTDQKKGDGSVDIKGDSRYITVDDCHFWDSGKCSLCGMKGETGPNWITYHHNWFDHSDSRHPRIRTMSVHVYNNYYDGNAKYGVGAAKSSNAFVESNYFRGVSKPMLISQQGSDINGNPEGTFSGEAGGMIKAYGNVFAEKPSSFRYVTYSQDNTEFDAYEVTNKSDKVPSSVKAKNGGRVFDNWDTDPSLMYSYTPDAASDVPSIVTGWYGAGRLNKGDFSYDLSGTDKSYTVDETLSNKIQNYTGPSFTQYE